MKNFIIKVKDTDSDIHIYTNVSSIEIKDEKIKIEHNGDQSATHLLEAADEILIKNNHHED